MDSVEEISLDNSSRHSIAEIAVVDAQPSKNIFKKIYEAFKECIEEYFSLSSIAGLPHLRSFGISHRIFWLLMLTVSLTACYFTYLKLYKARKIVILHEPDTVSTSVTPFPAVTVCTIVKADHRKFNYAESSYNQLNLTSNENVFKQLLERIVFTNYQFTTRGGLATAHIVPINLNNIESLIYELGIKEQNLITSCSIDNKNCSWSKILTADGLCYVLNLLAPQEMFHQNIHKQYFEEGIQTKGWTYKDGYKDDFDKNVYPLRGFATNKDHELKIRPQINLENLVNSYEQTDLFSTPGFPIYIGHPMDYPFQKGRRLFVPLNTKYTFNVIPDMILTNDQVIKYPLKARNCFVDETEWDHLKIMKVYSVNNCELECLANHLINKCICNQFWIPGASNKICGRDASHVMHCYKYAAERMFFDICNCSQPCSSLTYDVMETLAGQVYTTNHTYNFSDVTVRFSESDFLPKRRQESYSDLEILSAIGGTMGLFVGASVITVFETVYYFSIKIIATVLTICVCSVTKYLCKK